MKTQKPSLSVDLSVPHPTITDPKSKAKWDVHNKVFNILDAWFTQLSRNSDVNVNIKSHYTPFPASMSISQSSFVWGSLILIDGVELYVTIRTSSDDDDARKAFEEWMRKFVLPMFYTDPRIVKLIKRLNAEVLGHTVSLTLPAGTAK